jgi:hypothetical protein
VHEKLWLKMYPDHNFGGIFDVRAIEQTFDIHDTLYRSQDGYNGCAGTRMESRMISSDASFKLQGPDS